MKVLMATMISAALFVIPSCTPRETPPAVAGNKAPSFVLRDLEGKKVSLSDFQGKAVIMDFWATWCHSCKEMTSELEGLHKKFKDRGVVVVGVSMDGGVNVPEKVKDFVRTHNLTYLMLLDSGEVGALYAVHNIPVTYLLDRNHVIVKIYPGYMPGLGGRIAGQIEKIISSAAPGA